MPLFLHFVAAFVCQSASSHGSKFLQPDWRTEYERSNFVKTSRYAEDVAYCRRLEKASPWVKVFEFGKSPEGRPMIAVILSRAGVPPPAGFGTGQRGRGRNPGPTDKPLVLINNGIHAGEIEGKDASLI